ncbi:S24 family peptidase [Pantoea ananatis]|uniref:HumD family translesion DNA polymerase n=1 Tax=Pantoea ananas TaxID=553 RepID=UPI000FEC56AB|nr:S24 family peptidase [Pantoea ananatis]QAB30879.1 LexA family transcriptional regulator [Pantoea ananatis]
MGFPSPAQDYVESRIDLNKLLVSHPHATYFIKADAHYPEQGILKGAMLVVDSSVKPVNGSLVVASPEDEMKLCRVQLRPFPALTTVNTGEVLWAFSGPDSDERSQIFGVVTYVVNKTMVLQN